MADKISSLVNEINSYLSDRVLSRQEKRDLKSIIQSISLNEHDKTVFLSKVRDLLFENKWNASSEQQIEWFYEISKLIIATETNTNEHNSSARFSPGTSCREAICNAIRFANKTIRICVFTISDDDITEEIIRAHRLGKDVKIITDNDKSFDLGSDIEEMERAGIPVTMDNTSAHMHHKFALFDNKKLITGSYNWTRSAASHNHENIILTQDKTLVEAFIHEFNTLWKELN